MFHGGSYQLFDSTLTAETQHKITNPVALDKDEVFT